MDSRRSTISLPTQESATVREAKDLASTIDSQDASLAAWALRMIEAKDAWFNTKRRSGRAAA